MKAPIYTPYGFEQHREKEIKKFTNIEKPDKDALYNLFFEFLHPDDEREFMLQVLKNVVEVTHSYYLGLGKKDRLHFLRAVSQLLEAAFSLKNWEFMLSRKDGDWFWKGLPLFFSPLSRLAEPLGKMGRELNLITNNRLYRHIVLVEGEGEGCFLDTLKALIHSSPFDRPFYAYQGKAQIQNLIHYIREKNNQGVEVYLSFDKDTQSTSFLSKIKSKCRIRKVFGFRVDFESSFPPELLTDALLAYQKKYLKSNLKITVKDIRDILTKRQSFAYAIKIKYGFSLNKKHFAIILGKLLSPYIRQYWNEIFNEKPKGFFNAEIFKFIKFIF